MQGNMHNFREVDFIRFLGSLLERLNIGQVSIEDRLSSSSIADISIVTGDTLYIIECKKSVPQTQQRIYDFKEQIARYSLDAKNGKYSNLKQQLILAAPGRLAPAHRDLLSQSGISVWDAPWIAERASQTNLKDEAATYISTEVDGYIHISEPLTLGERLSQVPAGKSEWVKYQRLCEEIFEFLFCPPLRPPIREKSNADGVNRRDFIMPNYAAQGTWQFLRLTYRADYVVIDPKNYSGMIGKEQVLQIANYLEQHGLGLFAIIVTRYGADSSALITIREQWMRYNKMIITLQDTDVQQMLIDKRFGNDPAELLLQKIEDFRISI
ncbi:hypothetical protein [Streptosporangium sp. V21-05]|uniref:hypothetical protein n=1 Tax=Streptosporangium sp. V21-05 TaxID=3446115 RepID=UPI003F53CD1C